MTKHSFKITHITHIVLVRGGGKSTGYECTTCGTGLIVFDDELVEVVAAGLASKDIICANCEEAFVQEILEA